MMHPYLSKPSKFKMIKENFVEVAPSMIITPRRKSNFSKLETIIEEGSHKCDVIVPKRFFIALPVLLSMIMYFLLYKIVA